MDPTLLEQYPMNGVVHEDDFQYSLVSSGCEEESYSYSYQNDINNVNVMSSKKRQSPSAEYPPRPPKQSKTTTTKKPCNSSASDSSSKFISFDNTTLEEVDYSNYVNLKECGDDHNESQKYILDFASSDLNRGGSNSTMTRNAIQAQEHVMAERKRREKLNQRFIALSSIIPGLQKVSLSLSIYNFLDEFIKC